MQSEIGKSALLRVRGISPPFAGSAEYSLDHAVEIFDEIVITQNRNTL